MSGVRIFSRTLPQSRNALRFFSIKEITWRRKGIVQSLYNRNFSNVCYHAVQREEAVGESFPQWVLEPALELCMKVQRRSAIKTRRESKQELLFLF